MYVLLGTPGESRCALTDTLTVQQGGCQLRWCQRQKKQQRLHQSTCCFTTVEGFGLTSSHNLAGSPLLLSGMSEGHPAPRSHPNVMCLFSIYFFICSFSMSGKCLASTRLWMASRDSQEGSPGLSSHLAISLAEGQVDSNNTSIEKEP